MKIVMLEDFFHPDAGYQINIISKYLVKFGHQVTIITAELDKIPEQLTAFFGRDNIAERDRAYEEAYGVKIIRLPIHGYKSGRCIYSWRILREAIRNEAPDIVYAHGNDALTAMQVLWHRKELNVPLISDTHMDDIASTNRLRALFHLFYRAFVTPIICREQITVIRTADITYIRDRLGIPLELAPVISFGSDTMLFHPDAEARNEFRDEHEIDKDAFVVLYAGKMDESKGGRFLADLTTQKLDTDQEVVYLIIGNTIGEYGKEVEETFKKSPYKVLRFPTQKYADLAKFFQAADLAVIPKQCTLSLYDFNATGLPVLAEDNAPNVQRCGYGNGWTFSAGNLDSFRHTLEKILKLSQAEFEDFSKAAVAYIQKEYDYEKKCREYERELLKTLKKNG